MLNEADRQIWIQVRDAFLESKRSLSGSDATYKNYRGNLLRCFGDMSRSPANYSRQELEQWINGPSTGRVRPGQAVAPATVKLRIACLKSFFAHAMHYTIPGPDNKPRRLLPVDFVSPVHDIRAPKPARKYRQLSMSELEHIFASLPDTVRGKRDKCILTWFLLTGRRRSEILRLRWNSLERVTFESGREGMLYKYTGKGASNQECVKELPQSCVDCLLDYLVASNRLDSMRPDSPLFIAIPPESDGRNVRLEKPLQGWGVNETLKRLAVLAGIPQERVSIHSMRHTYARERFRTNGGNVLDVMRALGHSSLQITQTYLDELVCLEDDIGRKMEARFSFLAGQRSEVSRAR
jgi:integrase